MMMDAPRPRQTFYCDHCHEPGTTAGGGLWKTAPHERAPLYYLHSSCLLPYKARHGLRSVEGRLPPKVDGRWALGDREIGAAAYG